MHLDPSHMDPIPILNSNLPSSSSTKRKGKLSIQKPTLSPWRTPKQQQIYSSNLISALRRLRPSPPTGRSVRAAADRALAAAAGGRSRWSRAILSTRGAPLLKARRPKASMPRRAKRSSPAAGIKAKARVLGRLVPGCRKLPLPSLLDESADYIAALEVQVRAMSVIVDVLSRSDVGCGNGSLAVPS